MQAQLRRVKSELNAWKVASNYLQGAGTTSISENYRTKDRISINHSHDNEHEIHAKPGQILTRNRIRM